MGSDKNLETSLTALRSPDPEVLQHIATREGYQRIAAYKIVATSATLFLDSKPNDNPIMSQFVLNESYYTVNSHVHLKTGWHPLKDLRPNSNTDQSQERSWLYFPVQDLWATQICFLVSCSQKSAPTTGTLSGLFEALARRFYHWMANDELRHFIDEAALQEHAHGLGRSFTKLISHELRNSLTSLAAQAQLIGDDQTQTNPKEAILSLVESSTHQIIGIVENIEGILSRFGMDQELILPKDSKVAVSAFITDAVQEIQSIYSSKELPIKIISNQQQLFIQGEHRQARLALVEVLKNAVDYSQGTLIVISTRLEHEQIIIDIRENGLAVPVGQEELIFLRFFRGQNKLKINARQGLGLGLFLARQACRYLGGDLIFVRESGSKGVFRIILPQLMESPDTIAVGGNQAS
jgi:K+-sensing histidine kinase KdpD